MPPKISPFNNQLRNLLRDENHHYRIILIHLASNVALKTTKHLQMAGYKIFFKSPILVSLPHSLPDHSRKPRAQKKQRTVTILRHNNKLTGGMCLLVFQWVLSVRPVRLVLSFIFNQAACLLLHPTKPYRGVNFPYQHFHNRATKLFKALRLRYCTEVPVLHDRSQHHAHSLFYVLSIYRLRPQ